MIAEKIRKFAMYYLPVKVWRKFRFFEKKNLCANEIEIWRKYYPKGQNILDIGADRDSVRFFYENGAKTVFAIGDQYGIHVDAIKLDVEGIEKGMIIETHYKNPKLVLLHEFENGVKLWRLD